MQGAGAGGRVGWGWRVDPSAYNIDNLELVNSRWASCAGQPSRGIMKK